MRFFITIVFSFLLQPLLAQLINTDTFKGVNTAYDELQPVLGPDRKMIFFTIANHPQNVGGKKDPGDIWYSTLAGNQWTTPVHGGALLNDRSYNAVAGISYDGKQLFLLGHYNPTGGSAKTQGISVSRNDGSGWSKPENISIPYFQNKSGILQGYITPDKGIFVFSAETYGTRGVEDIYMSINEDGRWTEPKNLGNKINTQFQEVSPSLSADGKILYFSSNGRKGKGSFDVYAATRLDDTWSNWSEPVNLTIINTEGRELFYTVYSDLDFSIFTSTTNSDGYGDINMFRFEKPTAKNDSLIIRKSIDTLVAEKVVVKEEVITQEVASASKAIKVYGKVTNAKNGETIEASILISAPNFNQSATSTIANGFSLNVMSGNIYSVKIESNGFVSSLEHFDIRESEMPELEMNIKLQPVEVGTTVNLKSVLFERGTSNLLPESHDELDVVVSFLKTNASIKIDLNGHTDNRGVHTDNVKLSQERVDRVKQYLVTNGIDSKRITGKGYGGLRPIASNENEDTRRLNRRVEFTIKKF